MHPPELTCYSNGAKVKCFPRDPVPQIYPSHQSSCFHRARGFRTLPENIWNSYLSIDKTCESNKFEVICLQRDPVLHFYPKHQPPCFYRAPAFPTLPGNNYIVTCQLRRHVIVRGLKLSVSSTQFLVFIPRTNLNVIIELVDSQLT